MGARIGRLVGLAAWAVGCAHHEDPWTEAVRDGSPAAYEAWMTAHPGDPRVTEAQRRLDEILAWGRAEGSPSAAAYRGYLATQPEGAWRGVARVRIEEIDHAEALADGSTEALETFLVRHPSGRLAQEVRARLEASRFQQAEATDSSRSYANYLLSHPDGRHAEVAAEARVRAAFDEAVAAGTLGAWTDFARRYPDSPFGQEVAERIDGLTFPEVVVAVVLRDSWRPQEEWSRSLATLHEVVDYTLGRTLRAQGFRVAILERVAVTDPPAVDGFVAGRDAGLLLIEYRETPGAYVFGAGRGTEAVANLALYAPGAERPVWTDHLRTTSFAEPDTRNEGQLHASAVARLATALARTPPPTAAYLERP